MFKKNLHHHFNGCSSICLNPIQPRLDCLISYAVRVYFMAIQFCTHIHNSGLIRICLDHTDQFTQGNFFWGGGMPSTHLAESKQF